MNISESVSEKPRRGRPRSWRSVWADDARMRGLTPDSCRSSRSRLNWTLLVSVVGIARQHLDDDERLVLWGATEDELRRGAPWPKGWQLAAYEIGRLVDEHADDHTAGARFLGAAVDARRRGVSWRDIRAHFREQRLGKRSGDSVSLLLTLARAVDEYRSQYPATTRRQIVAAVEGLLASVRDDEQEAAS